MIRAYTMAKNLRVSKRNINFAPVFEPVLQKYTHKILKIVHFANLTLQNKGNYLIKEQKR